MISIKIHRALKSILQDEKEEVPLMSTRLINSHKINLDRRVQGVVFY